MSSKENKMEAFGIVVGVLLVIIFGVKYLTDDNDKSFYPEVLTELTKRYQEPHRHYHTLTHIAWMFERAKKWRVELSEAQVLAIWFHDAVYEPGRSDNEQRSAELARDLLGERDDIDLICQIIIDTKEHVPNTEESKLVLDLDMAILGANPTEYKQYAEQVREEFKKYPDEVYIQGRQGLFLMPTIAFAKNDELFFTEYGKKLNKQAIQNMEQEFKSLD